MLRQSQDLVSRVHSVTLVAACAAATISFCVGYWIKDALGLALLFIGAGYLAYERLTKQRSIRRDQLVDLPSVAINFPCPHCYQEFNLGRSWVCGWCKEKHDDWLNSSLLRTAIQGCSNPDCEETKVHELSSGRGDQAALQCPNCCRHIILDPTLYTLRQCHISPYDGVARMVGDAREPVEPKPVQSVYPTPPGSASTSKKSGLADKYKSKLNPL